MFKRLLVFIGLFVIISPLIQIFKILFSTYTAPRTWSTGELVTATLLNTHLRDNLDALKAPPTDLYNVNEAADYTTSSTSYVDVDATDLALTIVTTGGDVAVWFQGCIVGSGTGTVSLDVAMDSVRQMTDDGTGMRPWGAAAGQGFCSFFFLIQSVSAASHTFKLQWKITAGTATMYAGAGTVAADFHPQFGARELT